MKKYLTYINYYFFTTKYLYIFLYISIYYYKQLIFTFLH